LGNDLTQKYKVSLEGKKEKFYQLFSDSLKLHMRSDVEVGGCLSGGLDSSAIASGVSTFFPQTRFKTFTVYYKGKDEVDERPWVSRVLKKYPSISPFYFTPAMSKSMNHLTGLFIMQTFRCGFFSFLTVFFNAACFAGKNKSFIGRAGSDEMLAGYMHSYYRLLGSYISSFRILKYAKEILTLSFRQKYGLLKIADVKIKSLLTILFSEQKLYELEYKKYYPFLGKDDSINFSLNDTGGSRLNKFLYHLIFTTSLPTLLQYEDRNSMAFSIESRVPFLDHRLVEFVFFLDDERQNLKRLDKIYFA
jgi:asparagine synthase (glutamine-hydrolysing)